MTITSLSYAIFVSITILIYYLLPSRKYQWVVLLCASYFFYIYNSMQYTVYIVFTTITVFASALRIQKIQLSAKEELRLHKGEWDKEQRTAFKGVQEKKQKRILALALTANFGILFVLKYFNFMAGGLMHLIAPHADPSGVLIDLILPLGISFYTFQSTGYLIDVYRKTVDAEKNIFRFALFVSFFPQIVQGPISEFEKLGKQLTAEHKAEWSRFKLGFMLIVWGLFKKMLIADRLAGTITTVSGDYTIYPGAIILLTALMYALQLYADFSGGIDIVRGISCILGIDLEVNFRQPYFSRTLNEYWRRWHITLGAWMKKYVFYTLAMSKRSSDISKAISRSKFGQSPAGKHIAKTLPAAIASFIVFMLIGIWHGASSRYIGFGLWNGAVIMLSTLLAPVFGACARALRINVESALWKLFQMFRTCILVLIGYYFDIAPTLGGALDMMKRSITDNTLHIKFGQLADLGIGRADCLVLMYGFAVLLYFSLRLEKSGLDAPGELLVKRSGFVQWMALFIAIMSIMLFGVYGPGFDAADFVYMGF